VLNDNSMAIDRTQGGLAEALDRVRMDTRYVDLRKHTEQLLHRLPLGDNISGALRHLREGLRTAIHGPRVFETLGFEYFGPVDGHDLPTLIRVLQRVRELNYPVVLHVHTEKGRGCPYAVEDPCRFHSPAAFTMDSDDEPVFADKVRPTWTKVFANTLIEKATADSRIVAITAAMPDGTGLAQFRDTFPDRTLDVGIGESHAVAAAAGMAKAGLKPVVAIYSTFLQRSFDQVYHECSLQNLPVIFCMDRAGLVGSDGAVHHGILDVAYLRSLPGMTLLAPGDEEELSAAMDFALACEGPVAIRYPRDEVPQALPGPCPPFVAGESRTVREGTDATILAYGAMIEPAMVAADVLAKENINVAVVNLRFAKPLDPAAVTRAIETGPVVVIEDHAKIGGVGSAVLELACQQKLDTRKVTLLGVGDEFLEHASRQHQLAEANLTAADIVNTIQGSINS
jgi:1-deoxy-D-xylulose-5-phosphate synthase